MAADWESESEGYPNGDFLEYLEMLTSGSDGAVEQPGDEDRQPQVNRETRRQRREASAQRREATPRRRETTPQNRTRRGEPHAGQRRETGRREAPAHRPVKHHPVPAKRRRRKMMLLLVLILALGVVFIVSNITVSRVKGFQVVSATANQQVLSWKRSLGVDCYYIYDGGGALLAQMAASEGTQYAVNGLKGGTQYTYTIVAEKSFLGKHSGKATACSAYTLPETVHTLSATGSGTGVYLSWEDSGASGYEVQYTDGSGAERTMEVQRGGDGLSIPDLQEGLQYTFQVRSYLQNGESRVYSDWASTGPITAVYTVDMTGIDIAKPMVALTFDDGPDYEDVTTRILDTLKEYGGHASFFQLGNRAEVLPSLMTRIAEEGHEIACHTYDHTHYGTDVTMDDIVRADDAIEQACGKRPSAFRSPGGETTDQIREICGSEGIPIFGWNLDTADWQSRDADSICDVVMNNITDGDIVLMHNIYHSTADAVERIVPFLVQEGYQLVTVSQLVQAKTGSPPVPGTQYLTATSTN